MAAELETSAKEVEVVKAALGGARARVVSSRRLELADGMAFDLEVEWIDHRGETRVAPAHLWVPQVVLDGSAGRVPLCYLAGYEGTDETVSPLIAQGHVVANPGPPPDALNADPVAWNPLGRGPNFDYALLHVARALDFVDVSKVLVAGGSAGGYMALMIAAETFPVASVTADVPVVNLAYEAAYLLFNEAAATAEWQGREPALAALAAVLALGPPIRSAYGVDPAAPIYLAHSPVALIDLITGPVSVTASTADLLVPFDQIDRRHLRRPAPGAMPPGFSTDPSDFGASKNYAITLADALGEADAVFELLPVPAAVPRLGDGLQDAAPWSPAAVRPECQWWVAVLDEGPPEPGSVHVKHQVTLPHDEGAAVRHLDAPFQAQLTAPKLRQLLARLAGKEWLFPGLRHLDAPDAERADVVAGLSAYLDQPGAEERFCALYEEVAEADKRAAGLPSPSRDAIQALRT